MKRRQLLKAGIGFSGLSFVPSAFGLNLLGALQSKINGTSDPKFLVFCELPGGWDVTLGLDPWTKKLRPDPKDIFIEYRPDEVIQAGNQFFGPAAIPLIPHSNDFSVVNGVFVSRLDQGHGGARDYMLTGGASAKSGAFVLEALHSGSNGPYGVLADSDFPSGDRGLVKTGLSTVKGQISSEDFSEILEKLIVEGTDSDLIDAQRRVLASREQVMKMNQDLRVLVESGVEIQNSHLLAAAFLNGISYQGIVNMDAGNLDTHADHPINHLTEQKRAFEKLSELFSYFKSIEWMKTGRSLFDQTLFVVTSEFSRTPYLNAAKGKDHNPLTNSVLLAGCGIKGGMTLGESQLVPKANSRIGEAYHIAKPIDLRSGRVAEGRTDAGFIFPENILKTAALALGLDLNKIEAFDPNVASLPWLLK